MTARTTAYNRLADTLRHRILGGHWQAGQQLPTEQALCETFSASRITVRRALQILEEELLVRRRQGSGTFVSPTPTRKIPILNTDYFGSIVRHAPDLQRRIQQSVWVQADDNLAEQLDVLPGDKLLHTVRVDELRGDPVAGDELWLPERFASLVTEDHLAGLDFLDHWQAIENITLDYGTQTIEAARARAPWTGLLNVRSGEPLLRETNILYLTSGQRAAAIVSYYRHDYFRFDATIAIKPGEPVTLQSEVAHG